MLLRVKKQGNPSPTTQDWRPLVNWWSSSPFSRLFVCQSLHINTNLRASLAKIGVSKFQDFISYSAGQLVSRPSKRPVRTLELEVAGEKRKYFLKQSGIQSLRVVLKAWCRFQAVHSETTRELLLLELFRAHEIPVMNPVAWGTYTVFGWPVRGFILVEEVIGREFVEVYREASLLSRRRLMRVHGELMGTLHQRGIESKVHPQDLICISQDYTTFQKCLVVIDRERGVINPGKISLQHRGKRLAEIWIKGAFILGPGERSELLAFLSGYCAASGLPGQSKDLRLHVVDSVLRRAAGILARDDRFARLRPSFKEKYCIPPK
jgi:hypothetical protein